MVFVYCVSKVEVFVGDIVMVMICVINNMGKDIFVFKLGGGFWL